MGDRETSRDKMSWGSAKEQNVFVIYTYSCNTRQKLFIVV